MQLQQILDDAKLSQRQTIAIANANDSEVLQAVYLASEMDLADFQLYGNEEEIRSILKEMDPQNITEKCITYYHHENPSIAIQQAVLAVSQKKASILMKGNVQTAILIKEILKEEYGLRTNRTFSQVAVFELPNHPKVILLTDGGLNITPNLEKKIQITENAVKVARAIGIEVPKVAILAAIEQVNPAMAATTDAALITMMNKRGQIKDCIIDGPLAFDIAINQEAKEHKGIESEVAGDADILVVPFIEVANVLYKSFTLVANARVGSMLVGAKVPVILTSRADSFDCRLNSIALAIATANKI